MIAGFKSRALCLLWAMTAVAAAGEPQPSARQALAESGHAIWLAEGGPLSPLETQAAREGDAYILTVRGMYPIMDAAGGIAEPATRIMFWAQRSVGNETKHFPEHDQVQTGSWRPGDAFVAKFKVAKTLIEGRDPAYLGICIGNNNACFPSVNLSPP